MQQATRDTPQLSRTKVAIRAHAQLAALRCQTVVPWSVMTSFWKRLTQGPHMQTLTCAVPYVPAATAAAKLRVGHRWFAASTGEVHARTVYNGDAPRPTAVLVHGVGGSDASLYVRRAETAFLDAGYHVVSFNQRGAGDGASRAASLYHVGLTDDLDRVVRALAREPIHARIGVVGFSGGGNVALRLAAEWRANAPKAALGCVGISAPLDLARAAHNIERRDRAAYRLHVLRGLLRGARNFLLRQKSRATYTWSDLLRIRTLRDFDAIVTVPMHGFDGVDDYYERAGAGPMLKHIVLPSLAIHAVDDPMVPGATVETCLQSASPALESMLIDGGGHLGFIEDFTRTGWTRTIAIDKTLNFFAERLALP
jgi:uncharacterized protein